MIPCLYKSAGESNEKIMSKEIKLSVQKRDKQKDKMAVLRKGGFIPACLYGPGSKNDIFKVKKSDFDKVFAVAGESHLIDLSVGTAAPVKVIVKDTQRDSLSGNIIHADFYKVDMTKKITTEIPLHFIGASKAVKEFGGILVKEMEEVKVKCLAKDLVDNITVDLSVLENLNDSIRMHQLALPAGMEFVSHTDEVVVMVSVLKVEVEKPVEVAAVPAEGEAKAEGKEGEAKPEAGKGDTKKAEPAKKGESAKK